MKRDVSLIRLSRDHQRGLALSKRVQNGLSGVGDVSIQQLRQEVIDFWRDGLLPHFRAECECLLARLARYATPQDELMTRTEQDHVQVHALVTALQDAGDDAERRALVAEIAELLKVHIRWEEAVLFEATQARLAAEELARLGHDLAGRIPDIPPAPPWSERRA